MSENLTPQKAFFRILFFMGSTVAQPLFFSSGNQGHSNIARTIAFSFQADGWEWTGTTAVLRTVFHEGARHCIEWNGHPREIGDEMATMALPGCPKSSPG